ncbi:MAG: hypothetical protein IJP34_02125 [Clostridia bacterium]|nr:hypothetical protein [Clostridia bacterium]
MSFYKIFFVALTVIFLVCGCKQVKIDDPLSDKSSTNSDYQTTEDEVSADRIGDTDDENGEAKNPKPSTDSDSENKQTFSVPDDEDDENNQDDVGDNANGNDDKNEPTSSNDSDDDSSVEYEDDFGWSSGWK